MDTTSAATHPNYGHVVREPHSVGSFTSLQVPGGVSRFVKQGRDARDTSSGGAMLNARSVLIIAVFPRGQPHPDAPHAASRTACVLRCARRDHGTPVRRSPDPLVVEAAARSLDVVATMPCRDGHNGALLRKDERGDRSW